MTLAESGVAADEATSKKAVANRLGRLAVVAAARMAGLPEPPPEGEADEESLRTLAPKNPVIEESLVAMLTLHVVSKMKRPEEADEVLKLLNTDSENPYLVWDLSTRAELMEFLENERTSSVRTGTCDPAFGSNFKFTAHENELVVGGIFVRIFNQQPMFQLQEPKRFAVDLLEFLNGQAQYLYSLMSMAPQAALVPAAAEGNNAVVPAAGQQGSSSSEKLIQSEMALEALSNVIKHNKGKLLCGRKDFLE